VVVEAKEQLPLPLEAEEGRQGVPEALGPGEISKQMEEPAVPLMFILEILGLGDLEVVHFLVEELLLIRLMLEQRANLMEEELLPHLAEPVLQQNRVKQDLPGL
jgi:hypothetical protein